MILALLLALTLLPPPGTVTGTNVMPAASTMPAGATPTAAPTSSPNDAVIRNSGSTNTLGYVIIVHPDATAYLTQDGTTAHKILGRSETATLFAQLKAAGPLDTLSYGRCMHSASFGSITTVSFAGRTSGDLGCGGGNAAIDALHAAVGAIVDEAGATAFGARFKRPL